MELILTVDEALALAAEAGPLPPFLTAVRADGDVLHADIDLRALPSSSVALRLLAAAAGGVTVDARFASWSEGAATFTVRSASRSLPLHPLVNALTSTITAALRDRGLSDVLAVRPGEREPLVVVQVQGALARAVEGVTITDLALRDGALRVRAEVGRVRRVPR
jgi:hypothetical protein